VATVKLKGSQIMALGSIKVGQIVVHEQGSMDGSAQPAHSQPRKSARIFTRVVVPGKLRAESSPTTMIIELTDLTSQYFDQLTGEFSQLAVRPLHEGEVVEIKN
jgi:hypothetical protein